METLLLHESVIQDMGRKRPTCILRWVNCQMRLVSVLVCKIQRAYLAQDGCIEYALFHSTDGSNEVNSLSVLLSNQSSTFHRICYNDWHRIKHSFWGARPEYRSKTRFWQLWTTTEGFFDRHYTYRPRLSHLRTGGEGGTSFDRVILKRHTRVADDVSGDKAEVYQPMCFISDRTDEFETQLWKALFDLVYDGKVSKECAEELSTKLVKSIPQ